MNVQQKQDIFDDIGDAMVGEMAKRLRIPVADVIDDGLKIRYRQERSREFLARGSNLHHNKGKYSFRAGEFAAVTIRYDEKMGLALYPRWFTGSGCSYKDYPTIPRIGWSKCKTVESAMQEIWARLDEADRQRKRKQSLKEARLVEVEAVGRMFADHGLKVCVNKYRGSVLVTFRGMNMDLRAKTMLADPEKVRDQLKKLVSALNDFEFRYFTLDEDDNAGVT